MSEGRWDGEVSLLMEELMILDFRHSLSRNHSRDSSDGAK